MLLRIALLLLIAWIAWRLLRRVLAPRARVPFEDTVRCSHCGAFLPRAQLAVHQAACDRQPPPA